jgi:hypothetical protein
LPHDTSGDSTVYGGAFAPGMIRVESMQIFSDGDSKEDDGDTESIKALMLAYRWDTLVEDSPATMQSDLALRVSNPLP